MRVAVNVNGRLTDDKSATISVFDHGFLYGEGVYETLRTYNGRPFLLYRHLQRLRASSSALGLTYSMDDEDLVGLIDRTMAQVDGNDEKYIRVLLTRGIGELSYDPVSCPNPTTVVIVRPYIEVSSDLLAEGASLILSSIVRNHPQALNPQIKSNNLLNNALAMQEALRAGADEALMCNYKGEVAECAQSNVFIVKNGSVLTPPLDAGLLEGITRNFVCEIGPSIGIPVYEQPLSVSDLFSADEVFITGTTREVLGVREIDRKKVGAGVPGQITRKLATEFKRRALDHTKPTS